MPFGRWAKRSSGSQPYGRPRRHWRNCVILDSRGRALPMPSSLPSNTVIRHYRGLRTWLGQIIHAPVALCADRGKMITVKPQKSAPDQGIGLYTNEQTKYTTPFQYFAQIVVGAVVIWLGAMLAYAKYQSPFRISPGLIAAIALIAVGMFQAHAGAIFWYRRLRKRNLSH